VVSETGFPHYFLATLAVKTPPALALLLLTGLLTRRHHTRAWREEAVLWLPALVYLAVAMARALNIGHRHLLPMLPFLWLLASRAGAWVAGLRGRRRALACAWVGALLLWHLGEAVAGRGHALAYFNPLGGGRAGGYRVLVDSNLDWGQDLARLGAWTRQHRGQPVKVSCFGTADLEHHGVEATLLPGHMLPPARVGWEVARGDLVAVSATVLAGLCVEPAARPLMEALRRQEPVDRVGDSILVYRADFDWHGRGDAEGPSEP